MEIKSEMSYKNGKLDGVSKVFSEEGVLLAEAYFTDGEPNGVSKEFYLMEN